MPTRDAGPPTRDAGPPTADPAVTRADDGVADDMPQDPASEHTDLELHRCGTLAAVAVAAAGGMLRKLRHLRQVAESDITAAGKPRGRLRGDWECHHVPSGAVVYVKRTCSGIPSVARLFFSGAGQTTEDAMAATPVRHMLAKRDGLVCIAGKRGFDPNAAAPSTYASLATSAEDARSVVAYLKAMGLDIDAVAYSLGCNDAVSASADLRGMLLIAPLLHCPRFCENGASFRRQLNVLRFTMHRAMTPWLVEPLDLSRARCPMRLAIGDKDVIADPRALRLRGGHRMCLESVTPEMVDFEEADPGARGGGASLPLRSV